MIHDIHTTLYGDRAEISAERYKATGCDDNGNKSRHGGRFRETYLQRKVGYESCQQ